MTVSRVINGESNVRDTTRELVMEAVRALNYRPNPAARVLAGARDVRIALIYSNPSASYLSEMLVGALDAGLHHVFVLLFGLALAGLVIVAFLPGRVLSASQSTRGGVAPV